MNDFKTNAGKATDQIIKYFEDLERLPVLPQIKPGSIKKILPPSPPDEMESFDEIVSDVEQIIIPNLTHWNHPNFMAYFNSTSNEAAILGEFYAAAFNNNGMLWKTGPASVELEEVVLDWFRQMLGLPHEFWGIVYDTASVSTMHALAAARENLNLDIRRRGLAGIQQLRVYTSEQAHSSVEKSAVTIGIGLNGVRKIPVDASFRLIPEKLSEAIAEDKKNGMIPFCVVATIGTTSTTSVDPVREIAAICKRENIWLHVDAAYAGVTAILPEKKRFFEGWESADSIVINPHKWMFVPIDFSVFFTRRKDVLKQAFSLQAEYLRTKEDDEAVNYMDYGIQLGRRFRSLKFWFTIRHFGVNGIKKILREHLRLSGLLEKKIVNDPEFELMAPVNFGVVCFRSISDKINRENLNRFNSELLETINSSGKLFLSHTALNGKYTIRISASGLRTNERHVKEAWQLIKESRSKLIKKFNADE